MDCLLAEERGSLLRTAMINFQFYRRFLNAASLVCYPEVSSHGASDCKRVPDSGEITPAKQYNGAVRRQ